MKVLNYTSYKKHYDLYTEIHGSIAASSCQVELTQKDIFLLSRVFIIVYKAGKRTGVENANFIISCLNSSAGTYSINDFNTKVKIAILQQRQDWEPPQIKKLRLVMPEDYLLMADTTIFIALGIQYKYLEKVTLIRSSYLLDHTKHPLKHHLLQKLNHCTVSKSTKS